MYIFSLSFKIRFYRGFGEEVPAFQRSFSIPIAQISQADKNA